MTIGDKDDIVQRQVGVLPPWFPDLANAPVLKAILGGVGGALAFVFNFYTYAKLQTRIATATSGWLDLIAWDFFGGRFVRRNSELDAGWRLRIVKEILRPRQTRAAITQALQDLTTRTPLILEFFNPQDMGGYDVSIGGYGVGTLFYGDQPDLHHGLSRANPRRAERRRLRHLQRRLRHRHPRVH
jgi:hypothetical protein